VYGQAGQEYCFYTQKNLWCVSLSHGVRHESTYKVYFSLSRYQVIKARKCKMEYQNDCAMYSVFPSEDNSNMFYHGPTCINLRGQRTKGSK
jgi:hypothetical protein